MNRIEDLSWKTRALAAERTCEVLKTKVQSLMNGEQSSIQKRLERARVRDEENRRKREVMAARATELTKYNVELESEVALRTRDLKTILDNVTFGFLVIDQHLQVQEGYTRSCRRLLGVDTLHDANILDLLRLTHATSRDHYALSVDEVFEDFMPEAVTLHQMPSRFDIDGRKINIEARAVRDEERKVRGLLLTLSDVTELELAQEQNETNTALLGILKERSAFENFLADTRAQLQLAQDNLVDGVFCRRVLHTIKGNTASWGLSAIADAIHVIEGEASVTSDHLHQVSELMEAFLSCHASVLEMEWNEEDAATHQTFEVSSQRLLHLRGMIEGGLDVEDLRRWTAEVSLKPAKTLIGPVAVFIEKLAQRLEKVVHFQSSGLGTLVDAHCLQPVFQNLTHLFRNAVDHGIEPAGLRQTKPFEGTIALAISEDEDAWTVVLSDDGRGIDVDRLTARALADGHVSHDALETMTVDDKVRLIFLDGLSSASETTDISGRGIGMSAVLAEVERANGTIVVDTALGEGTTFTIRMPKPQVLIDASGALDAATPAVSAH